MAQRDDGRRNSRALSGNDEVARRAWPTRDACGLEPRRRFSLPRGWCQDSRALPGCASQNVARGLFWAPPRGIEEQFPATAAEERASFRGGLRGATFPGSKPALVVSISRPPPEPRCPPARGLSSRDAPASTEPVFASLSGSELDPLALSRSPSHELGVCRPRPV